MSSPASELDSLPGLRHAKKAVLRTLASNSGVHAVLLYGPAGAGKSRLARFLAKSWMCPDRKDGLACGVCNVCSAFETGRAVDFQLVPPWGPQNLIKLSALMYVPDWEKDKDRPPIEFVLHYFRTRPLMASNKVVLFEHADRMNAATANAFLKTLEEPGQTAKIILTTQEFTRVLPTIRSRCMCLACEVPEPEGLVGPASVFGRSPGSAATLAEHPGPYKLLYDLLESSLTAPWGAALKYSDECREIAEAFAKVTGENARGSNVRTLEAIGDWLCVRRPERPDLLFALAEAHKRAQGNVGSRAVFETLFLDLMYHD